MSELIALLRGRLQEFFGAVSGNIGVTVAPPAAATYTLSIAANKTSVVIGEVVTFSGVYKKDGVGVVYGEVTLNKNASPIADVTTDAAGNYSVDWYANVAGSFTFNTSTVDPGAATTTSMRWRGSVSPTVGVTVSEGGEEPWPKPIRTFLSSLIERFRGA